MGAIGKLIIGLLLVIASGWWIISGPSLTDIVVPLLQNYGIITGEAFSDFLVVLNGGLPPLIFLIGIFIVWLEYDEWKIEKELAREKRRARKKKRR
jgi:hypothetical protein